MQASWNTGVATKHIGLRSQTGHMGMDQYYIKPHKKMRRKKTNSGKPLVLVHVSMFSRLPFSAHRFLTIFPHLLREPEGSNPSSCPRGQGKLTWHHGTPSGCSVPGPETTHRRLQWVHPPGNFGAKDEVLVGCSRVSVDSALLVWVDI